MRSNESDFDAATLSKKLIQHIDVSSVLTAIAAATDAKTQDRGNLDLSRCIFEPESSNYFDERDVIAQNMVYSLFARSKCRLRVSRNRDGDDQRWPLVIRGNIMLILDRVLSSSLNVSRLLRERDNVTMVLDMLREVRPLVGLQGPNDSEKEYIVAPAADVQDELEASEDENGDVNDEDRDDENDRSEYDDDDEEYDDERDLAKRTIDALEESGAENSIVSNRSVSPTYAKRDDDSVHLEEEPSRVTVVAEHCGARSWSTIMQTCLSVFSRLIDCHRAEEEGHMYQDVCFSKYGWITHFEGSSVSPIIWIKQGLCEGQTLRFLVDC
ncbi:hypothetical protein PsorP6_017907 [Peronosclerospora sorghi]|uniref:Uncharacterized protein n=1 Tax=Peronosclerospora sorghi TaxID=230839 RepID=A0ACC0WCX9_9STRA|nr:hypothetical protein PsorP6_017907 [Peronosclerospora sorghi]